MNEKFQNEGGRVFEIKEKNQRIWDNRRSKSWWNEHQS